MKNVSLNKSTLVLEKTIRLCVIEMKFLKNFKFYSFYSKILVQGFKNVWLLPPAAGKIGSNFTSRSHVIHSYFEKNS